MPQDPAVPKALCLCTFLFLLKQSFEFLPMDKNVLVNAVGPPK